MAWPVTEVCLWDIGDELASADDGEYEEYYAGWFRGTEQVKRSILESQMSFVDTGGFEFEVSTTSTEF
jgi:hypothetical protein